MNIRQMYKVLDNAIDLFEDGSYKMSDVLEQGDVNERNAHKAFNRLNKSMEMLRFLRSQMYNVMTRKENK